MNSNSLTKDIILQQTNCNEIYIKFLGLVEFPKGNISSPFSKDEKPSFKVYTNGTFKCNSTGRQGDVWQFVADLKQLDCRAQFDQVLEIVANEMNLVLPENLTAIPQRNSAIQINGNANKKIENIAIEKESKKLSITPREFTSLDIEYWRNLGVDKLVLEKFMVHSISSYCWTDKKPIYTKKEGVAFSFELDGNFKLYIPEQPKIGVKKNVLPAFTGNSFFGFDQLNNEKLDIIICEGEKDTIVANSRGFNAVTFGSGSMNIKQENIKQLRERCNNLFVCFDTDQTGITGMQNLIKSNPEIIPIYLPKNENIKGYDITDYFQDHTSEDFQKIIDAAVKNKGSISPSDKKSQEQKTDELTTIFHVAESYLSDHYEFRYNAISLAIEVTKKNETEWIPCNENSLWLELQKKSIKVPLNSLIAILKSDFVPTYNPLQTYFKNLTSWDKKTDYIKQFSEYVILEENESREQFTYHFKKWCVRAVKCATIESYFNKQAFILTDNGNGQNIGKTSWCRFLCPNDLTEYIAQDIPENEKDARILFAKNFLVNLDELASLSRKEINKLKSYFTLDKINERLPYDRKNSIIPRVASFIGSTNMSTFLQDETGSVRWLCFIVKSINWNYKTEFNINNLWSQAYALAKDENFDSEMSREDIHKNELRNEKFQIISPEMDLIKEHFEPATTTENAEFLTATGILKHIMTYNSGIGIRLTNVGIGKALKSNGFKQSKHGGFYGYWVKKKDISF